MEILAVIFSILSGIISGLVLLVIQKFVKAKEDDIEKLEELRAKESFLILKSIDALGKLAEANTIALRDGKVNGVMSNAIAEYEQVKEMLYNYLLEKNSYF